MVVRHWNVAVLVSWFALLASQAEAAQMQARNEPPAVAAPTQPIAVKPLDIPSIGSDAQNIQAIVSRDGEAMVKEEPRDMRVVLRKTPPPQAQQIVQAANTIPPLPMMPEPIVEKPATLVPPVQVEVGSQPAPAKEIKQSAMEVKPVESAANIFTSIRVAAIRWYEVMVLVLLSSIALFTGMLYRAFTTQNILLARTIRAVEDTSRAAQRSVYSAEMRAEDPSLDLRTDARAVKTRRTEVARPARNQVEKIQASLDLL